MRVLDPIDLEVLRSRLEAIGEQACAAVEHTAISPTVTESKDYSVTLLDADGGLIVGTGTVLFHYRAASHAVRSTIERHAPTLAAGDDLRPGHVVRGPALIDGSDTTIWIPAGAATTVDAHGTLDVEVAV